MMHLFSINKFLFGQHVWVEIDERHFLWNFEWINKQPFDMKIHKSVKYMHSHWLVYMVIEEIWFFCIEHSTQYYYYYCYHYSLNIHASHTIFYYDWFEHKNSKLNVYNNNDSMKKSRCQTFFKYILCSMNKIATVASDCKSY